MPLSSLLQGSVYAALGMISSATYGAGPSAMQQTLMNLGQAFQTEAVATQRYDLFARRADRDGYPQIARLFRAASRSEAIHRDNHANAIRQLGGKVPGLKPGKLDVAYTKNNLSAAIDDEKEDSQVTYPRFIEQARAANANAAVQSFEAARQTEVGHVKLFSEAQSNMNAMKPMDYYVNRATGIIKEVPKGQSLSSSNPDVFMKVG